jgi:hypothetical protein
MKVGRKSAVGADEALVPGPKVMDGGDFRLLRVTVFEGESLPAGLDGFYFVVCCGQRRLKATRVGTVKDGIVTFDETLVLEIPFPWSIPGPIAVQVFSRPRGSAAPKKKKLFGKKGGEAAAGGAGAAEGAVDKFVGECLVPADAFDTRIVEHHYLDLKKWSVTKKVSKDKGTLHVSTQNVPATHQGDPEYLPKGVGVVGVGGGGGGGGVGSTAASTSTSSTSAAALLPPPPPPPADLVEGLRREEEEERAAEAKIAVLVKEYRALQERSKEVAEAVAVRKDENDALRQLVTAAWAEVTEARSRLAFAQEKEKTLKAREASVTVKEVTSEDIKQELMQVVWLERDLTDLEKDLAEEEAAGEPLQREIASLSLGCEVLTSRVADQSEKVKMGETWMNTQLRSAEAAQGDAWFRKHFDLSGDTEVVVDSFSCMNSKLMAGTLYVSRDHVCFDSHIFSGGANLLVLPVREIKDVKRAATALVFDTALVVTMENNGGEFKFTGFMKRNEAVNCIADQAAKFGIKCTR